MTNPARELADILEGWVTSGTSPARQRLQAASNGDSTVYKDQSRAMRYYLGVEEQIETLISAGVNVEHFRDFLPRWQDAIFSRKHPWGNNSNGAGASKDEIAMLRSLAAVIDANRRGPQLTPDQLMMIEALISKGKVFLAQHKDRIAIFTYTSLVESLSFAERALIEGDLALAVRSLATYGGLLSLIAEEAFRRSDQEKGNEFAQASRDVARDLALAFVTNTVMGALGL